MLCGKCNSTLHILTSLQGYGDKSNKITFFELGKASIIICCAKVESGI